MVVIIMLGIMFIVGVTLCLAGFFSREDDLARIGFIFVLISLIIALIIFIPAILAKWMLAIILIINAANKIVNL